MTGVELKKVVKAIGSICVVIGGFGSILCVPYAVTSNWLMVATAGIYFVAGAVMITGGLITVSLVSDSVK